MTEMKAKKLVYRSEESFFSTPRVLYGKIVAEDEEFISFFTGAGKSYRIARYCIISIEDTEKEFKLQEARA